MSCTIENIKLQLADAVTKLGATAEVRYEYLVNRGMLDDAVLTAYIGKELAKAKEAKRDAKLAKQMKQVKRVVDGLEEKSDKNAAKLKAESTRPEFDKLPAFKPGQNTMTYAGIGSRETPPEILAEMTKMAKKLESLGYKLQTGKTYGDKEEGADKAFSDGATNKELFGPEMANDKTKAIAKEIHPAPQHLKEGGLKLMARNTNQVFGANLDIPVDFVLFYAEETSNELRPKGGTGQAVEMARRKGIPTINMADPKWKEKLVKVLEKKQKPDTAEVSNKSKIEDDDVPPWMTKEEYEESLKDPTKYEPGANKKEEKQVPNRLEIDSFEGEPKVISGNLWDMDGYKVVPTNLGGIHGAGVAAQARIKGFIKQYENKDFDNRPDNEVITLAVKGKAPETVSDKYKNYKNNAFAEQVIDGNVELLKEELNKLLEFADTADKHIYMPAVGIGHGEGIVDEIKPILLKVASHPNITLVIADETADKDINTTRGTARVDNNKIVREAFAKELGIEVKETPKQEQEIESKKVNEDLLSKIITVLPLGKSMFPSEHMKNGILYGNRVSVKQVQANKFPKEDQLNEIDNFGNPFATAKLTDDAKGNYPVDQYFPGLAAGQAAQMYLDWLLKGTVPEGYKKDKALLERRRQFILNNLEQVRKAKKVYYAGTAKDSLEQSHVYALLLVANNNKTVGMKDIIQASKMPASMIKLIEEYVTEDQKEVVREKFKKAIGKRTYEEMAGWLVREYTLTKLGAVEEGLELPEVDITKEEYEAIKKANDAYKGTVLIGNRFEAFRDTGVIMVMEPNENVTKEMYEVYKAHEIRHAMTYGWIKANTDSRDYKYLLRALDKADKVLQAYNGKPSEEMTTLKERMAYANTYKDDIDKVSEIVAILSAEPNVRRTFMKMFSQEQRTTLERILDAIKEFLGIHAVSTNDVIRTVDKIVSINADDLKDMSTMELLELAEQNKIC